MTAEQSLYYAKALHEDQLGRTKECDKSAYVQVVLLERSALPDHLVPRLSSDPLNTQKQRKIPHFRQNSKISFNINSYNPVVERKTQFNLPFNLSVVHGPELLVSTKYSA